MAPIKGLEVLFSLNQREFKSKEDCVVAALHSILINADLSCVGLGEAFSDQDSGSSTELLPEQWNENQDVYCLRYLCKDLKNRYLLKIVKAGSNLHINLVLNEEDFAGMTIDTSEYVSEDYSKFSQAYKNLDQLKDNFWKEVLNKISVKSSRSGSSSSSSTKVKTKSKDKKSSITPQPEPIPTIVPIPVANPIPVGVPDSRQGGYPVPPVPQIGGSDLDPFGRSQGSMFFDPTAMGSRPFGGQGGFGGRIGGAPMGLGPHAVPPGARFDPFSPINPGRFNPDPDHFRPPDYDNMFM